MIGSSWLIGPVWMKIQNGQFLLGVSRNAPMPDGVLPRLHCGLRADHLSIPLEPRLQGKHAGRHWVHLTYPDGEHVEIATPLSEAIQTFGTRVTEYLDACFTQKVFQVSPSQLSSRGYQVIFYDEQFPKMFDELFKVKPRRYRISLSTIHRVAREAELLDPAVLEDPRLDPEDLPNGPFLVTCLEQTPAQGDLFLRYYQQSPIEGGAGWYAWPVNLYPQDFIAELVNQHVGPPFWEFMKLVSTELGLPFDFTKLDRVIAQARMTQ